MSVIFRRFLVECLMKNVPCSIRSNKMNFKAKIIDKNHDILGAPGVREQTARRPQNGR